VNPVYDIEIFADRFEQEEAYRLECSAEMALENAAGDAVMGDLEQRVGALLERQDAQLQALEQFKADLGQTEEETGMFEAWLS